MKTSYRASIINKYPKLPSITFKISCDCNSPDCGLVCDFEIDHGYLTLNLYKRMIFSAYAWEENRFISFLKTWKNKFVAIFKILFYGYLETEECLILQGEDHIQGFIDALEEGRQFIAENREK